MSFPVHSPYSKFLVSYTETDYINLTLIQTNAYVTIGNNRSRNSQFERFGMINAKQEGSQYNQASMYLHFRRVWSGVFMTTAFA